MAEQLPRLTNIQYHQQSRILDATFEGSEPFRLSAEYLRVYSPSAEVRGHGPGQEILQTNKERVKITKIEPVGNYAVCLYFDDGHDTGIYSFEELYDLGVHQEGYWADYLKRLEAAGHKRKTDDS
uniref:DUF971 family protein n=1 Tax=Candidatus Kentrum sp. TUN TaxID=2126343 RepID=A0A450ZP40_9GAMM|nr:MAG: DUF971 family protein [Candidatus Kentron sp. TUN]VFK56202.1 MAG: DUF971 family protein [Candidatus Kentron sp. TUN]VFK62443.1 MAG: DUF971 family protein [Candidatus Kentron sp. TUN]